ncbi:DUF5681 domain-containing protein [Rhodanobacter sp. FW102-FHT14D06]|uniref:DUF5681 domain-containing protein n=2 Tax=unclassified Rhodanobacter TaxID=2621553 RepID=A0AB74UV07_9GAMM
MAKFVKGQSGNPGGRPKTSGPARNLARVYTVEAIETLAEIMRDKKANHTARAAAATALLDRGWGKPTQQLDHTGTLSLEAIVAGGERPE